MVQKDKPKSTNPYRTGSDFVQFFPEASYASVLGKPIIPLIMQKEYKPDGWLGLITAATLYFKFTDKYAFEQKAAELVKELETMGNLGGHLDEVDVSTGAGHVQNWSNEDVHNWLSKLGLDR